MKPIQFSKMHGLGNDFVVIDAMTQKIEYEKIPIKKFSDRHCGIGFDQLLLIEQSKHADFSCRIFNSDGSEAEQCGNGMRCITRFIHDKRLSLKSDYIIETKAGLIETTFHDNENISVNMGIPQFKPFQEITISDEVFPLSIVSMGNPHAILKVNNVKNFPVEKWGPLLSKHPIFPHESNVGFMEIINHGHIRLRTFERGAGETLACGSNSCAAVAVGIKENKLDKEVRVELALGSLWIKWQAENAPLIMTGPAEFVFDGEFVINDISLG